eukprot:2825919-Prymnesium_polylepis.1
MGSARSQERPPRACLRNRQHGGLSSLSGPLGGSGATSHSPTACVVRPRTQLCRAFRSAMRRGCTKAPACAPR